jgi:hypothetical protein
MVQLSACKQQSQVVQNPENEHVRSLGQAKQTQKYKRLTLGDGQAYDRSSDHAVVVA